VFVALAASRWTEARQQIITADDLRRTRRTPAAAEVRTSLSQLGLTARFGRRAFRLTTPSPVAAFRTGASWPLVAISSAGVQAKMSHSAARTASDSRSGMPEASRRTWEAERPMPRSCSSGTSSVTVNMPWAAMTSRSRHW
jgi:hypothetical protein